MKSASLEPPATQLDPENPWPGLDSFDEGAQDYFHGREAEADELLRRTIDAPLTVLFGKSGLGKTSLLKAGLFPRLRRRNFLPVHVRFDIRPGASQLVNQIRDALAAAIADQKVDAPPFHDAETLWEYLHGSGLELWSQQNYPLTPILVLDQFEEVFTLGERLKGEVDRFKNDLGDLAENRIPAGLSARQADDAPAVRLDLRSMPYKVVLTLREDFLPHLEGWRPAVPSVGRVRVRLLPMKPDQALSAVYDTAPHLMDRSLAHRIVQFVAAAQTSTASLEGEPAGEIEPALLSLFCRGLNERRKKEGRTRFDAELLHGAQQGIIADHYRSCLEPFPESVSRFIERELITAKGFRNSYALEDAVPAHLTQDQLKRLIDQRLLRVEERYGTERIELTHDVLTPAVLAHRKERDAEDARAALAGEERSKREALEEQARQQRQRLRAMSLVALVCLALAGFAAWQLRVAREATRRAEEERQGAQYSQFVAQEARKEAERRQIEANEQREIADGARVEAEKQAAAATASAADAEKAKQLAEQQARVAYSRELAAATVPFIEPTSQDELAILLALQAVGTTYNVDGTVTREAEDVLRRAVGAASLPLAFPGHTAAINAIAFSSSGSEVATCSADGTARVWNATTGEQRQSISVGKCDGLTFGADGLRLVRSEFGGREVDVADAMSGGLLLELRLPRGEQVQDFVLSANGRWLATNHVASGLRIWPIERDSRATQVPVVEETRRSQAVALSANGRRLAYAQENSVHIADLEPTRPVRSITTRNLANTIALSLDGSLLAVSTGTAGVQVLEVSSEREIATVPVERPEDLVFSPPDGRYLAALTTDGISLWETASGKPVRTITGRRKIAFSPDGQRLAVSTGVTSVEITELTSGKTVAELFGRQESEIRRVALSPNGKFVVTSSQDRRLTVWDAVSGRSTMTVRLESGALLAAVASAGDRVVGHRRGEPLSIWRQGQPTPIVTEDRLGELFDLRFVAGGKRVVTGGRQGERLLTIWDTESGQATEARYAPSRDDVGRVRAIAFSDDEQRVAVATNVSTTVSDTTSGKILFEVDKPWNDIVLAGSTGQWLALSDGNSTVVWDVNTRTRVGEIAAGVNPGLAGMRLPRLAMRDAGRTVAVVDKGDQTVSLWDARNGSRLSTLYRHGGNVLTLAFVEGGTRLRVVADDWTVHDHPVDIRRLMTLAQTRVKRPLTVDECKKYLSLPSCPAR